MEFKVRDSLLTFRVKVAEDDESKKFACKIMNKEDAEN
jgi:hypothetical protein